MKGERGEKMKVFHTGDIHLGEMAGPVVDGENARMLDTMKCMDFVVVKAAEEKPDAIVVAGDLFHKSKLWGDQILKEINIISMWLRKLAAIAPTVVLYGTDNHDNKRAFINIMSMRIPSLIIIDQPQLLTIETNKGPLQIAGVPGLDKGHFRTLNPGMDKDDENRLCSLMLEDIVQHLSNRLNPIIPSILLAHYTVIGCELDNGEHVFMQNDVVLPKETLFASPYDLVCLGHIHKAQKVGECGRPVFYCGAINGITFNEEGQDKGFWIHELGEISRFITTPYRSFKTVSVNFEDVSNVNESLSLNMFNSQLDVCDSIVRFHYQCTDEQKKQISHKTIEDALKQAGAFFVQEIKPVQIIAELQKNSMSETNGPIENLVTWLQAEEGIPEEEIPDLVDLARPLIDTISAKMPTGKLSGVFEPVSLEVKNYRSYYQESFEFADIKFATVNGPNGVGKSAFFMDAISDCLYEETREGELTGWIANGMKSGSLTFAFAMGDSLWRVIRTRTKSGKITLALQESLQGEWKDRNGTTVKDTQQNINNLLGMDVLTFRSCAMIMQDAYGLFLEAELSERMEVLGNILGLGLYDQLKELAKLKYTAVNQDLGKLKTKIDVLDDKLKNKPELEQQLGKTEKELKEVKEEAERLEKKLQSLRENQKDLEIKSAHKAELINNLNNTNLEIDEDNRQILEYQEQVEAAQKIVDVEATIIKKCTELESTRTLITQLKAKLPRLNDLKTESTRITSESSSLNKELNNIYKKIASLEEDLGQKEVLQKADEQYKKASEELNSLDKLGNTHYELMLKIEGLKKQLKDNEVLVYQKQLELDACIKKSLMLKNSDCIDSQKARCVFLLDAQTANSKISDLQKDIEAINTENQPIQSRILELESQKKLLGYDYQKHCDIKELVAKLRVQADKAVELSGKSELLKNFMMQKSDLLNRITSSQNRMESLQKEIGNCERELVPLRSLEEKLPQLEHWATGKEKLPVARETIKNCGEMIKKINEQVSQKVLVITQTKAEIDKLTEETIGITKLQVGITDTNRSLKIQQDNCNRLHGVLGGLQAQVDNLTADQEERTKLALDLEPTAILATNYQVLMKAFDIDGIPFSIVRQVVPELSNMANDILAQMTGGKMSLEMKTERIQKSNKKEINALEIWITDYVRGSLPYRSRSGGQKVKAALSIGFALADLKARRAGIQLGMMFVDEPPFLDAEGIDAYCDALELLSQRYPTMRVMAISHDPRMKARFPQQIEVEDMGEAGSKIRVIGTAA
ncbi:metallophosphoesterase [Bacteroides sp.]|uniref:metallophosphoesterase n=1 Tax=Bacteroides sp. TaxID=29523 RepID=UPI002608A408|nr:metallophosphoesterase [Bacteroides sp.]MDD3040442.1 metallophosphoesterase [Bacteroides sp.]